MNKAKRVKDRLSGFNGYASLYRLEPPMHYTDYFSGPDNEDVEREAEYVIVSAADVMFSGPETYIFPATSDGKIVDWGELPGSFKGGLDHAQALEGAGYEVLVK